MVQAEEQERIIHAYFNAINEERLDDLLDVFGEGAVWISPLRAPTTDRNTIKEWYSWYFRYYPKHWDTPINIIHGDGQAAVEIDFEITSKYGNRITGQGVDVFKFRDGKIASLRINYDSATILKQSGHGQLEAFANS